jgi:hypothetical protein
MYGYNTIASKIYYADSVSGPGDQAGVSGVDPKSSISLSWMTALGHSNGIVW